jgi:hypothetical protein
MDDQEASALHQRLEETYANNPRMLDALRANTDSLDGDLRNLPPGTNTSTAIDHLRTQNWFGSILESFQTFAPGGPSWDATEGDFTEESHVPNFRRAPPIPPQTETFPRPSSPPSASWYDDNYISLLSRGGIDQGIFNARYDASCPSEFYRGYVSLLGWISKAIQQNPTLSALRESISAFGIAVRSLARDQRQEGANFALMNVTAYANAGTIQQIQATLDAEMPCIAHCFIKNRQRGL